MNAKVAKPSVFPFDVDAGIAREVRVLRDGGIETFESCQGGQGHPCAEPTVRFHGQQEQGFRAFAIAKENGLRVTALRRYWDIIDGEPVGPQWEMTFYHPDGAGLKSEIQPNGIAKFRWE